MIKRFLLILNCVIAASFLNSCAVLSWGTKYGVKSKSLENPFRLEISISDNLISGVTMYGVVIPLLPIFQSDSMLTMELTMNSEVASDCPVLVCDGEKISGKMLQPGKCDYPMVHPESIKTMTILWKEQVFAIELFKTPFSYYTPFGTI